jgi:DNA polymerase III subunit gamma/tau
MFLQFLPILFVCPCNWVANPEFLNMAKKAVNLQELSSDSSSVEIAAAGEVAGNGKYTVVARRYRPKTFEELVGQSTVSQALMNAIQSNRVGHAYLFTGARGVGKTSTARIFAKALNASAETNGKFDPASDIALAIDSGEDMDVIEIDGASNRGIDEIRQLRANAAVRPSRSRYKIYIIDEVHMLTTQAFNALLKTLEEPPGHVKFIFCTTDPEKMPITVLSRCQRFDFPPVQSDQIYERLKFICQNEGTKADEAALRLIARRAAGSMRDSQSLVEQLLSFSGNEITAEVVHAMLGTADETRLASFALRLIERDSAGALRELDTAIAEGVDVGQIAEQLLGYLRDMMAMSVGSHPDLMRTANPNSAGQLAEWGKAWGTMTLLSALQLLDETIVKMRHSVQSRILLEVALVQICNLQDLQSLSDLVRAFATGQSAMPARPAIARPAVPTNPAGTNPSSIGSPSTGAEAKKKDELAPAKSMEAAPVAPVILPVADLPVSAPAVSAAPVSAPSLSAGEQNKPLPAEARVEFDSTVPPVASYVAPTTDQLAPNAKLSVSESNAAQAPKDTADSEVPGDNASQFRHVAQKLGGFAGQCAAMTIRVESISENQWQICLGRDGLAVQEYFQTGDNCKRLTQAVKKQIGRDIHLSFLVTNELSPASSASEPSDAKEAVVESLPEVTGPSVPQAVLIRNAMNNALVKLFMDAFEGQIVRVDAKRTAVPKPHSVAQELSSASQEAN